MPDSVCGKIKNMTLTLSHLHKRVKRNRMVLLDKVMYVVALLNPLALLPQVLQVYSQQNVEGLSMFSWAALVVINICWIVYGFAHKAVPVYVSSILLATLNGLMVLGILLYR